MVMFMKNNFKKEKVMLKQVLLSILFTSGLILASNTENTANLCDKEITQDCWNYDDTYGWVFHLPVVDITPEIDTDNWSHDSEKGWIFNAPVIQITPNKDSEKLAFKDEKE